MQFRCIPIDLVQRESRKHPWALNLAIQLDADRSTPAGLRSVATYARMFGDEGAKWDAVKRFLALWWDCQEPAEPESERPRSDPGARPDANPANSDSYESKLGPIPELPRSEAGGPSLRASEDLERDKEIKKEQERASRAVSSSGKPSKGKRKTPLCDMPEGWPDERQRQMVVTWAVGRGIAKAQLGRALARFKAQCDAKPKQYAGERGWTAAFRNSLDDGWSLKGGEKKNGEAQPSKMQGGSPMDFSGFDRARKAVEREMSLGKRPGYDGVTRVRAMDDLGRRKTAEGER